MQKDKTTKFTLKSLSVAILILALIGSAYYGFNMLRTENTRYDTPYESFENGTSDKDELVDVFINENVALIIYRQNDGTYVNSIVSKDDKGWTPLNYYTRYFMGKKTAQYSGGWVICYQVDNKSVLLIFSDTDEKNQIPVAVDNCNTDFSFKSYDLNGELTVRGIGVLNSEIPNDYVLTVNDERIVFGGF